MPVAGHDMCLVVHRDAHTSMWVLCAGWIMPVAGDDTRARCRYCRILLRAHTSDLRNHARSSRHATSVAFGRPCSDPLTLQNTSRTKNVGPTTSSRKRFGTAFSL